MTHRMLRHHRPVVGVAALALLLGATSLAVAQTRSGTWTVDQRASLAWWQVNPHMAHLWATTCPQEPSWRPGEGRSAGWFIDRSLTATFKHGFSSAMSDTSEIPLYPRHRVRPLCTPAVKGEVHVADVQNFSGITGWFTIDPNQLVTGENMRDTYSHRSIFETQLYPEIRYVIDSVVNLKVRNDTLRGIAVGTLTVRNHANPLRVGLLVTREGGGYRARGKSFVPADALTEHFGISDVALGLGVGEHIWKQLWMGVDLLLRAGVEGGS